MPHSTFLSHFVICLAVAAALSRPGFLLVNRDRRRSAHTSKINNLHVGQSDRNRPKSAYTGRT